MASMVKMKHRSREREGSNMTILRYRISANLLCHDVRLNTRVEVEVELDHPPGEEEAIRLLAPAAEARVARAFCEDCPYDLTVIEVQPLGPVSRL
jgi:hypothetical protein